MSSTGFIISFFLSKKISLITTFLCWNAEELHLLWRASQEQGLRARAGGAGTELPAHGLHREGGVLDLGCPHADLIINAASESRGFNYRYTWLLLHNSTFDVDVMNSILSDSAILPDAEVTFASIDKLVDVYRVKVNEPFVTTTLGVTRDSNRQEFEALWGILKTTVTRRKNLNNIYLKAATTITQPQNFKGWDDLTVKHIDTFPKLTYPLLLLCAEDLNFRLNLRQVDLYGEQMNGSFNGLAGLLQRSAVELGVTSMFMRPDRLGILHFCSETVELRGAFIFRQPPKSSVSNVFLLPFSRGVWCACGGVLAAAGALLAALATPRRLLRADPALVQITPAEAFTFAIGTICQQGFHVSPRVASVRLVMFCTLLASLFAFTSYSAKIVAILQTPSDAIRTIDDLSRSPMTLGVQETTYKRVYFAESEDPATQRLYRRKLLPLGERAYLSVVDGVARLRSGLFAFQVEESSGYDIISKTFTESEKCGLKLIQAFKLPMVAVPIRKHSGYRELFAVRLRWQREVGLIERSRRIWLAARARCDAAGAGFISVRLSDVLPAVQVLLYGTLFAVVLLFIEIAVKRFTDRIKHKSKVKDLKDL
ncbi:ionotropic receptor 75a-like isoform X1 [Ostrinia furnacalis]|uniref:ionotropic receptor 75a-like isoform X1 n=1 Tax=Ostrinia furnacalis TaxID=93504 RepID=UPI00103B2D47|nr:ionotropic receptor 75a-like isoform X1 [Ostrinia furnacalis]